VGGIVAPLEAAEPHGTGEVSVLAVRCSGGGKSVARVGKSEVVAHLVCEVLGFIGVRGRDPAVAIGRCAANGAHANKGAAHITRA